MFRDRDLPLRLAAALLPPRLGYGLARRAAPLLGGARQRHVERAVESAAAELLDDPEQARAAGLGFAASIACDDLDAWTAWLWPRWLRLRTLRVEGTATLPPPGRAVFASFHLGGGFRIYDVLAARGFSPAVLAAPPDPGGNLYDRLLARARFSYLRRELGTRLLPVGPRVPRRELRSPAPHLATGGAVIALLDVAPATVGVHDVAHTVLFGRALEIPAGLLRLAASAQVPVVPFDGRIERGRRVLRFHPPIVSRDVQELAHAIVRVLETVIRERPWDWQGWLDASRLLDVKTTIGMDRAPGTREPARLQAHEPLATQGPPDTCDPRGEHSPRAAWRRIDVVVPIHDARADVELCLASLLAHIPTDARLVLIDDASRDAQLVARLDDLAARDPRILLLRNAESHGFVSSANAGLREARARGHDALLLNSDTIVPAGFLERLRSAAHHTPRTGIVSPLTNNGTICSVPEFMHANPLPEGLDSDAFDALVRATSPRQRPEIFTAHGFCMLLRAEVLERVGLLDEQRFPRGYGEENDLCERAKAQGFEVRLCDDLLVYHRGGASFGAALDPLLAANLETLGQLHPGYHAGVQRFVRENPLAEIHASVKYHLARRSARRNPAMLFWLHANVFADPRRESMGGTQYHVLDLVRSLALPRALIAHPEPDAICVAEIEAGDVDHPRLHRFPREPAALAGSAAPGDAAAPAIASSGAVRSDAASRDATAPGGKAARDGNDVATAAPASPPAPTRFVLRDAAAERQMADLLELLDVRALHIHQLLGWPVGMWRVLQARGIPYAYTVQDYYCVCPSWNLLDFSTAERCGCHEASPGDRRRCLDAWYRACELAPPADPEALLREHREEFGQLLSSAALLIAPCHATREIVARAFPDRELRWAVIGYGYQRGTPQLPDSSATTPQPGSALPASQPPALLAPHPPTPSTSQTAHQPPLAPGEPRDPRASGSPSLPSGELRIALIGAVAAPWKGAEQLLEVMRATAELPLSWHVFGDAGAFGFTERARAAAGPERIQLHGRYRREEIVARLAGEAIDLSLLLSPWDETFCYTLSESWAAGVPAIVSNRGALAERVRNTGAGLVAANPAEVADAIRSLLDDRRRLAEMRHAAWTRDELTPAENAARHRAAYPGLLERLAPHDADPPFDDRDRALFEAHWRATHGRASTPR